MNRFRQKFENFQKAVNRSFRGRIQNLAPEVIAEDVFSKRFSVKGLRRLMNLAEAGGVKAQYRGAIANQLRRRFLTSTSGLQLNALEKFAQQNGERLAVTMGGEYVRDMRLLLKGLKTIRTSADGIATTRNPTLLGALAEGAARLTVARPLSPGGVGLTRALRFRERAAQRVLAEAISDPSALRAIVVNGKRDLQSRQAGRVLAALGGSSLAIELNDE